MNDPVELATPKRRGRGKEDQGSPAGESSNTKLKSPGKVTPRKRSSKNSTPKKNLKFNGIKEAASPDSARKIDLRLEAKLSAEENSRLFAGRQIHPFFSSWKTGKKSQEPADSEHGLSEAKREGGRTTCDPTLVHVFEDVQEDTSSLDWSDWTFLGDTTVVEESLNLPVLVGSVESLNFDNFLSASKPSHASISGNAWSCSNQLSIQPDNMLEISPGNAAVLASEQTICPSKLEEANMDLEGDEVCTVSGQAGIFRNSDAEPLSRFLQESMASYYRSCQNKAEGSLWINKYKPTKATEVCGNSESLNFLRDWLHLWRGGRYHSRKDSSTWDQSYIQDEDDDFNYSDSDYALKDINEEDSLENVLLITGPVGSGKSAAVYACAEEQGFEVLELNASDYRNGAAVKQYFGEALETHGFKRLLEQAVSSQNKTVKFPPAPTSPNGKAAEEIYDGVIDLTTSSNDGVHSPGGKSQRLHEKNNVFTCHSVQTLILVEDVDILFPEDHGCIAAIKHIAETAKGPIILTSNSNNVALPGSFIRLHVSFSLPLPDELLCHLYMVCVTEEVNISPHLLKKFIQSCDGDIRITIHLNTSSNLTHSLFPIRRMSFPAIERVYVTEDCVREWKTGNAALKVSEPVPMLRFLYELCWTMVRGELPLHKCKTALDSVIFSEKASPDKIASNFADIVTQMAQDHTMSGEFRSRLIKLARWLVESDLVPVRLLHERCEEEFLGEAELIKIKAQELKGKEVRVNTRLLYQQTKFNLLREESEGYAKLVTLLCRDSEAPTQKTSSTIGIIKSLIGHFDLDPNRVFDIVLECFELQPNNDVFIELIPIFPKSHASQILGFKFQYYQRMEVSNPVPFGLYRLTALLVKQDFIDLDSIYAHLLPKDDEAFEHYNTFSSKRFDEANKIGRINLAATGKDLMDEEKQGDVTIDLFAALDTETEAIEERMSELQDSQTLGLLTGFLAVDDWYHAHILFERLSTLNAVEHTQICDSLFRLIEKSISSAYDVIRQAHVQNPGSSTGGSTDAMDVDNSSGHGSFINLPKELFQMLACTGPYLYRDTMLLQKVCRVLRGYYLSALELVNRGNGALNPQSHVTGSPHLHLKDARLRVEDALGACLLPSLQLIPANPAVGQEIWELMSLLPYEVRYRLYGEWEKDDERIPMLLAARQTAKLDTRRILKRLAKENLKQLGRMVAKLAHANPMTVLRTIVHQIEAYRDMITPVVDAFKYLTQLEYDILEYVVIERLALGGRDKLKDDGLNLSDWLQSLASFWGHLCKKYPSMELRGLFQYLVNQLKKGQGIELVLLQELIQQMANVQYTENLTEEQLDAMAGSETLRYQATSFGVTRNNKALVKSSSRLRDSLLPKDEPKLAVPLLLLLAQHRSLVVINADAPYIKMVSEQFDRCHGMLLQYVEFLGSAVSPASNYAILIPSLSDLVHLYHLDPEVAFLIYRPVMRLFKSHRNPDVCWPLDDRSAASDVSSNIESDLADHSGSMVLDLGSGQSPISWSYLLDTVKTMLPSKAWNSLSPDLYATFWGLTLYDLYVPKNRYESEITKLHANLKSLEELSDNSSSAITKRKKEKERIQESLDRLTSELHKHEENVASVRRRLSYEKDKWLSSCPDTLKINMEFLQRCIFPRCTFSMPDAVYCAMFVHTLHSLGTPFFNTVNHIDVLICKTLQPMICCCTEYEVGRLGRFLYETLKIAYYWKSDESIYERECGNMPGFAVYYRYPNSQRVAYGQFIKVHWKWSQRITRLLIQCLESSEYMEIRNALIMLTKISSVFPVTRKSGINLEKRVAKIKGDEREDLKVLATGVAAALAARKPSWVTDEEFGMGYLELKPAPSMTKSSAGTSVTVQSGISLGVSQTESASGKHLDSGNTVKDQITRTKTADGKSERSESITAMKSDSGHVKIKGSSIVNGLDAQSSLPSSAGQSGTSKSGETPKQVEESIIRASDEHATRTAESRTSAKRSVPAGSLSKPSKQDPAKEDGRSGKPVTRASGSMSSDKDIQPHASEGRHTGNTNASSASANGNTVSGSAKAPSAKVSFDGPGNESKADIGASKSSDIRASMGKDDGNDITDFTRGSSRVVHSPRHENTVTSKSSDKSQKRASSAEELDRLGKRRKGDVELRDLEGEARFSEREKLIDPRLADDKLGLDEIGLYRAGDKPLERPKDKGNERYEREHRERLDRLDKSRGDDFVAEKPRDRSIERYGRERSVERIQERGSERSFNRLPEKAKDERSKDDRNKLRYNDAVVEKSHADDRFHGQSLPPPPPLPPNMVPQSVSAGRRDEDADRRYATRHSQRLSPRHEEKERRRSEETVVSQDDPKRRKEDDFRDRKREEMKVEEREREREREKVNILKEDLDLNAASKRRKLKREHLPTGEPGEYSPVAPPPPGIGITQAYDGRDRGDRKGPMIQHASYIDEPGLRIHSKEVAGKMNRRDSDPLYDREWDDEKRQRADQKRRHRK